MTALLAFALYALHREWIVLGSTHRECIRDRDEYKAQVKAHALAQTEANALMRQEFGLLQQTLSRRRST